MSKPPAKGSAPHSLAYIYSTYLPYVHDVAQRHGYASAVHGSMVRDLDVVLVPWAEEASSAEVVIEALCESICWYWCQDKSGVHGPEHRPHGRLAWSILTGGHCYIDVSVMPRAVQGGGKGGG